MRSSRSLAIVGVIVIGGFAVSAARADAGQVSGFGYYAFPLSYYGQRYVPQPPYFALHPPVYYGERYARPYGASPFACACQLKVPDSYRAHRRADFVPLSLHNPHYKVAEHTNETGSAGLQHAGVSSPPIIENPFYRASLGRIAEK
jgi:hypothetical protein